MQHPKLDKIIAYYKKTPVNLTHKQEVQRLYRQSLRVLMSWCENRELFNEEATKLRAEFDANKDYTPGAGATLVKLGKQRLQEKIHPDPYIAPYMPGGTLFMRNPAFPMELLYPHGIPEGKSNRKINIDMSNPDGENAEDFFVDSASKSYWSRR